MSEENTVSPSPRECMRCKNFFMTYEPHYPYACRIYGFKGREAPCLMVLKSSGQPCQAYEPRLHSESNSDRL